MHRRNFEPETGIQGTLLAGKPPLSTARPIVACGEASVSVAHSALTKAGAGDWLKPRART